MLVSVIHQLQKRTRFKTPGPLSPALTQVLFDTVKSIEGVQSVTVNPRTGSIVVTHDHMLVSQLVHSALLEVSIIPSRTGIVGEKLSSVQPAEDEISKKNKLHFSLKLFQTSFGL